MTYCQLWAGSWKRAPLRSRVPMENTEGEVRSMVRTWEGMLCWSRIRTISWQRSCWNTAASWARFRGVSIRTSFLAQRETRTAWGLVLASVRQMHADHADRDGETLLVRQRLRTIEVAHVHRVSLLDLFLLD